MDKILITAFKDEIASAILNSQKKLNPDGDAYISQDELPAVLDFFGQSDVSKLLKNTDKNNSVFSNNEATNISSEDLSRYTELVSVDNAALNDSGTAAYNLQNEISSELRTSSIGTPYAAQMNSLYEESGSKSPYLLDEKNIAYQYARYERQNKEFKTTTIDPYLIALGNTYYEYIPGYERIYIQKPDEVQYAVDNYMKQFN